MKADEISSKDKEKKETDSINPKTVTNTSVKADLVRLLKSPKVSIFIVLCKNSQHHYHTAIIIASLF